MTKKDGSPPVMDNDLYKLLQFRGGFTLERSLPNSLPDTAYQYMKMLREMVGGATNSARRDSVRSLPALRESSENPQPLARSRATTKNNHHQESEQTPIISCANRQGSSHATGADNSKPDAAASDSAAANDDGCVFPYDEQEFETLRSRYINKRILKLHRQGKKRALFDRLKQLDIAKSIPGHSVRVHNVIELLNDDEEEDDDDNNDDNEGQGSIDGDNFGRNSDQGDRPVGSPANEAGNRARWTELHSFKQAEGTQDGSPPASIAKTTQNLRGDQILSCEGDRGDHSHVVATATGNAFPTPAPRRRHCVKERRRTDTSRQQIPSLLQFLRQQNDCLKCQPDEFHKYLLGEDVPTLSVLHDAVHDVDFLEEMKTFGLLRYKRKNLPKSCGGCSEEETRASAATATTTTAATSSSNSSNPKSFGLDPIRIIQQRGHD